MQKPQNSYIKPIQTGEQNLNNKIQEDQIDTSKQSELSQVKKKKPLLLQVKKEEDYDNNENSNKNNGEKNDNKNLNIQSSQEDNIYNLIVEQFQQLNQNSSSEVVIQSKENEFLIVKKEENDKLSFKDLKTINNLGRGSQSKVKKVLDTKNNKVYALKEIIINHDQIKQSYILQEIQAMIQCKSNYILQYHGAQYKSGIVNILLDFMDLGSLHDLLQAVKQIPEVILGEIIYQILMGLQYLHKQMKIIHRDIKPANILINTEGQVKIADFGVSGKINFTNDVKTSWVGTVLFMSPERLQGNQYDQTTDVWSLGMMCIECLTGSSPIKTKQNEINVLETLFILNDFSVKQIELPKNTSPQLRDFLEKCLEREPQKRSTSTQLLNHQFIQKYHQNREQLQQLFKKWILNTKISTQ